MHEAGFERPPEQTEFARLELDYTVLSKRKLLKLVNEGRRDRVGTIPACRRSPGMRRRGVTPEGLRNFAEAIGVARKPARTELATFEHYIRDDLNMRVPRVMAVLNPLKVVLTNYPGGSGRRARGVVLPARRPAHRVAQGPVLAGAVDRAG